MASVSCAYLSRKTKCIFFFLGGEGVVLTWEMPKRFEIPLLPHSLGGVESIRSLGFKEASIP